MVYIKTYWAKQVAGHKTNHSLRATAATQLFDGKVPEKPNNIQECTGHHSFFALREYEHSTPEQQVSPKLKE